MHGPTIFTLMLMVSTIGWKSCYGLRTMPEPLAGTNTYQLRMPGASVEKDDAYICTAFKLDENKINYITGFRVEGSAERAHHMILRGCAQVPDAANDPYWNCGSHGDCRSGSTTLFAWANNAPALTLPPQVGFRIGGNETRVQYLVVQVHYAKQLPRSVLDFSGMDLEITSQPQRYTAGILVMIAQPLIPPLQKKVNIDTCCPVSVKTELNVFAARVHAHKLGVVISGYKYNQKTGETTKITKGNPQWPQAFFPTDRLTLDNGDDVLARCTYSSEFRNRTTYTGATGADEMCNLYIMYYTDEDPGPGFRTCGYLCNERQVLAYPADSDEPLPRNPVLEAYALHGAHSELAKTQAAELIPIKFGSDDSGHSMHDHHPAHAKNQNPVEATTTTTTTTTTTPGGQVKISQQQVYEKLKRDEENYWNMVWLFYHRLYNWYK